MRNSTKVTFALLLLATPSNAFNPPAYHRASVPVSKLFSSGTNNPFEKEGIDLDLPDFDKMFSKIQQVSPLAQSVIDGSNCQRGLLAIDRKSDGLKWKNLEAVSGRTVHEIQKVDSFAGISSAPMLRFRSSLKGPCVGEYFARYIMDLQERKKWDEQVATVEELHVLRDTDLANIAMGFGAYGDCSRMGVGYGQTKPALGITPREQLFVYGFQEFPCGSCMLWGSELDEKHDYLLPNGKRHTRAKSHLFAATLVPTSEDSFDVEYTLQLEIGGNIPKWLTTSPIVSTVKSLFATAAHEFKQVCGPVQEFMKVKENEDRLALKHSLLMTP